jgi:REP element-mobilizing transposase RayT
MTAPRRVLPGSTYLVTRRCTQRQFLLRPSALVNQTFTYCLAYAASQTGVLVHAYCALSNHFHAVVTDPDARLPEFMACLDKLVSKCVNASLGRWESLWSSDHYSAPELIEPEDVFDKLVYVTVSFCVPKRTC